MYCNNKTCATRRLLFVRSLSETRMFVSLRVLWPKPASSWQNWPTWKEPFIYWLKKHGTKSGTWKNWARIWKHFNSSTTENAFSFLLTLFIFCYSCYWIFRASWRKVWPSASKILDYSKRLVLHQFGFDNNKLKLYTKALFQSFHVQGHTLCFFQVNNWVKIQLGFSKYTLVWITYI